MRIAAGRKTREIDPAQAALARCVKKAKQDPLLSAQMLTLSQGQLAGLIKLGAKVANFFGKSHK